jgi:hypothetical protein
MKTIADIELAYKKELVVRMGELLNKLYGPRGGLAKKHRALEFYYYKLKGELELAK